MGSLGTSNLVKIFDLSSFFLVVLVTASDGCGEGPYAMKLVENNMLMLYLLAALGSRFSWSLFAMPDLELAFLAALSSRFHWGTFAPQAMELAFSAGLSSHFPGTHMHRRP
mmetsp:Transcript_121096/g.241217  ORF Transcript_121096/g.241217 Transcript_121096/m.241217 type:complete len:111 (-) Transcript_121096:410-742(-)